MPIRRARPGASWTSRPRSRRRTSRASRARISRTARRSGRAPQLEQKAPGIDWGALLGRRAARRRAEVRRLSFRVDPEARRRWSARSRCRTGRTGWPSTRSTSRPNVLPKPFRDASFAFYGTRAPGHAAAAPARRAGAQRDQRRAAGRGRQGLRRQIFPGLVQGRDPDDGRQHQGCLRAARAGDRLDGAGDQAGSAEEGRRASSSASAIPTAGAIIPACRSRPTTPTPT